MRIVLLSLMMLLLIAMPLAWCEEGEEKGMEVNAVVEAVLQDATNDTNSSKFNEYRDIKDGFYFRRLMVEGKDKSDGLFFQVRGKDLLRKDQKAEVQLGSYGDWKVGFKWDRIPHLFSNKAKTPYIYQGSGLYRSAGNAGISSILAPSLAQDNSVLSFLNASLHPADLEAQREEMGLNLSFSPLSHLKLKIGYSLKDKEGFRVAGAGLGDRVPNLLDAQLPEPIDYTSRDLRFDAAYTGDLARVNLSYVLSRFENRIDSLTWQSIFYGATGSKDYNNTIGRAVSTFGRMALYPDNEYRNYTLSFGMNLPLESYLAGTLSFGSMKQDEELLPYSFSSLTLLPNATPTIADDPWNSLTRLPRRKADARIDTALWDIYYTITPLEKLNLRASYRYYALKNDTAVSNWFFAVQDTANTNGTVSSTNQRRNLPSAYSKSNAGLEAHYSLGWGSFMAGYEREEIRRKFREADTTENIFRGSLNSRINRWASFNITYLQGNRKGDGYSSEVYDQSYHFDFLPESGPIRPYSGFRNHPDLRKSDVADREKKELHLLCSLNLSDELNLSLSHKNRHEDFDSHVVPTRPLAGTGLPTQKLFTPGNQLGLLDRRGEQDTLDLSYTPSEKVTLSAYLSREKSSWKQRGHVYDPFLFAPIFTTQWTDPERQWFAFLTDSTNSYGFSSQYVISPEKLTAAANYSYSSGTVEILYTQGRNVPPSTTFSNPEKVRDRLSTFNISFEYHLQKEWSIGVGYLNERYKIKDWMQEPSGPWAQLVGGSENFVRDPAEVSWANRLVSFGSYLAPSYSASVVSLTLSKKW